MTSDECGSVSPGGLSAAALVSTFTKPNIQCPATGSYGWRWKCGETTPDPPVGNPVTTGVRLYSLLILSTRLFGDKELLARQDGGDKLGVPLDHSLLDGGFKVHVVLTAGVGGAVVVAVV